MEERQRVYLGTIRLNPPQRMTDLSDTHTQRERELWSPSRTVSYHDTRFKFCNYDYEVQQPSGRAVGGGSDV